LSLCCPRGLGCNAPEHDQPCVLAMCRAAQSSEPAARRAVARWNDLQEAVDEGCSRSERRFRRRSYEAARAAAMPSLLMRLTRSVARTPAPRTRLDVLLRQHRGRSTARHGAA
jgi:hypothetical protein